jgi:hypothetical protein
MEDKMGKHFPTRKLTDPLIKEQKNPIPKSTTWPNHEAV